MKVAASLLLASSLCLSPALRAQAPDRFAAYEHCRFSDDLALVENTPLAKGIEGRTVKTIMGNRNVPLAGGTRLMFAYPHTDFFANVKVEQIPTADYTQAKQDLIANFEQILSGDDSSTRNYALKPRMNGLEIYGLDRKKLEGGVLGIYLFFGDRTHTATTIYFLNQEPAMRKFDNLEDYARLRDAFLDSYTGCAAGRAGESVGGRTRVTEAVSSPLPATAPTGGIAASVASEPAAALPDAPVPNGVPVDAAPAAAAPAPENQPAISKAVPAARRTPVKKGAHPAAKKTSSARSGKKAAPARPAKKKKR